MYLRIALVAALVSPLVKPALGITVPEGSGAAIVAPVAVGESFQGVVGRVFLDRDGDGIFNGADHGLAYAAVSVEGHGVVFTDALGYYRSATGEGRFRTGLRSGQFAGWRPSTPLEEHLEVRPGMAWARHDIGLQPMEPGAPVEVLLLPGAEGMTGTRAFTAVVRNPGGTPRDLRLSLTLPEGVVQLGASPAPQRTKGNTMVWNVERLLPAQHATVTFTLRGVLDPVQDLELQAQVLHRGLVGAAVQARVLPGGIEGHGMINVAVEPLGTGAHNVVGMGSPLTTTVRFTAGDEGPIILLDSLHPALDAGGFSLLAMEPAGMVQVDAHGVLRLEIPEGRVQHGPVQGYLVYAVSPKLGSQEGTVVTSTVVMLSGAEAVSSNTNLRTLSHGAMGTLAVNGRSAGLSFGPNPAKGSTTIRLLDQPVGRLRVELVDANGRLLQRLYRRSDTITLDALGLPAGVYTVRVVDEGDGSMRAGRVVFE